MVNMLGNSSALMQTCIEGNESDSFFGNENVNELLVNTALPVDQFFVDCKWINNPLDCSSYFQIVTTTSGYCYELRHHDDPSNANNFKVLQSGSSFGLTLMIDIRQSEAVFGVTSRGAGASLLTHKRGSGIPDFTRNAIALGPGFEHNIALEKYVTKRLLPPYSSVECEADSSYTQSACAELCKMKDLLGSCSCWDDRLLNDNCSFCAQYTCANYQLDRYFNGKCGCKPECNKIGYKSEVSSFNYPAKLYEQQVLQLVPHYHNISDVRDNVMYVNIYFDNTVTEVSTEKAAVSGWQVISDLGGSLGLFLGASLITVAEILEFFFLEMIAFIKKHRARKIARLDKVIPIV